MAVPRVFISSTCYDLSETRHSLEAFIRGYGFAPVLSERGDVFYHPELHTHESCLREVSACHLLILIIGGRFGGHYKYASKKSVTNAEYEAAKVSTLPVFCFVKKDVLSDHHFYSKNKDKLESIKSLSFPSVEKQDTAIQIFDFIDDVRLSPVNNGLFPFEHSSEIQEFLRKQWASMLFDFLIRKQESRRFEESFQVLSGINRRVEALSEQILNSVGSPNAKVMAEGYDLLMNNESIRDISFLGLKPTLVAVLENEDYASLAKALGKQLKINVETGSSISSDGSISKPRFEFHAKGYPKLRERLIKLIEKSKVPMPEFIKWAKGNG